MKCPKGSAENPDDATKCWRCNERLATESAEPPTRKSETSNGGAKTSVGVKLVLAAVLLFMAAAVVKSCSSFGSYSSDMRDSRAVSSSSTDGLTPGEAVMYEVIGNGVRVSLVYRNSNGAISTEDISTPWSYTISCLGGGSKQLYISAIAKGENADIAVLIKSGKKTIERSDSRGNYVTATATASVRC